MKIKTLRKNKKLLAVAVGLLILTCCCLLTLILLLLSPLTIQSPQLATPQIENPGGEGVLVNQNSAEFKRTDGQGLFSEDNGGKWFSSSDTLTVGNLAEGEQHLYLRSAQNFFIFRLVSKEATTVTRIVDYTPIQATSDIQLSNSLASNLSFEVKTEEEFDSITLLLNSEDKSSAVDCQSAATDKPSYNCKLDLSKLPEQEYTADLYLTDAAGNKTYLINSQKLTLVKPMVLNCNLPFKPSNTAQVSFKCKANKDGSYSVVGAEAKQVQADKEFDLTVNLGNEGENNIAIKLTDKSGNNFDQRIKLTKDTTKPEITIKLPKLKFEDLDKIPVTLSFSFNEKTTVSMTFRSNYNNLPSYLRYSKVYKSSFNLDANKTYSKTFKPDDYKVCNQYNFCFGYVEYYLLIEATDSAGNKFSKAYTIVYEGGGHD
jgi:hypothetical protein